MSRQVCFLFFLLQLGCLEANGVKLQGIGTNTFWPVIRDWANSYEAIEPFQIEFTPSSAFDSVEEMTALTSIDFAMIDFLHLNSTQHELGFRAFPLLQTPIVPQINLPNISSITLDREVLPLIYMGNITNWNDSAIAKTNPDIALPNATIKVFWRDGISSFNDLWSSALSKWSPEWNTTYGTSNYFPSALKGLPNFIPETNVLFTNAAVAATHYSIGYVPWFLVKRDPMLSFAYLNNKWGEKTIPDQTSKESENWVPLNEWLEGPYSIDLDNHQAWPVVSYIYVMLDTNPKDCPKARAMYKFFHWALNDFTPRHATTFLGCLTLTSNITKTVLESMAQIQCNGEAIGRYEMSEESGALELSILLVSILFFAGGCILSGLHVYYFSKTSINMAYSLVFIVGTALTLLSPIFWYVKPTDRICGARIWAGSIGFSILLATMFSRTWQLNDIYKLQKDNMDSLRSKKTAHNTLIQLAMTLGGVIAVNMLILIIWSGIDPLTSTWVNVDQYQLTGYWTCTGKYTTVWLILELLFFLGLLCFGIYVIYRTWSFQRQALLTETRWVLMALYNIIMNLAAVVPLLIFLNVTELTLANIIIISIDISGGSIVCAVLVPRVISKLELSTHPSSKQRNPISSPTKTSNNQHKREYSRTPEDELAKRLAEPLPLKLSPLTEKGEPCEVEMQPLSLNQSLESMDHLEISSSHQLLEAPVLSQPRQIFTSTIHEDHSPIEENGAIGGKKTQHTHTSLQWTKNPMVKIPGTPSPLVRPMTDPDNELGD